MYYLILLVFFLSLVAFFYFKFIFVPFFLIYLLFGIFLFFCASQESIMCFICKLLFSVLSLLAFGKSSEKGTVKTIQTIGKTQIPFDFAVELFWSSASKFALFLPTPHSNLCTGNHPTPKPTTFPGPSNTHLPRGLWERRCQKLPDVLRYTYF